MQKTKKEMVIITGYFKGESYGLLGPQMAATIITDKSDFKAIVVGVTNEDNKADLFKALQNHFKDQPMVVAFSSLSGRQDLFEFAGMLKQKGAITILAGPQAAADFKGETGWKDHDHRFKGMSRFFSYGLQGPAQQILRLLDAGFDTDLSNVDGLLYQDDSGQVTEKSQAPWDDDWLSKTDWHNLYRLKDQLFVPVAINCGQVLQYIGCQHAAKKRLVSISYPADLKTSRERFVSIEHKGCIFCDVAVDKGYMGGVSDEVVLSQIRCLPEFADGSKIAFELINESPLPKLKNLLQMCKDNAIELSQINLTMRADYFLNGLKKLEAALELAKKMNVRILLSSIGFESFNDGILENLNKGVTRKKNLDAIKVIRDLKPKFPFHFGYLKEEGANHGFIHPTPWDSPEISAETNTTVSMYQLAVDILPPHSTPLIIHHASGLADWIREIETRENIQYKRIGTTIAWWDKAVR